MSETSVGTGKVVSVNVSEQQGTSKKTVADIVLDERGVRGDAHAGDWHRQVSLLAVESIERFAAQSGRTFAYGEFAENITTSGLPLAECRIFDCIEIGKQVKLEVTQLGKKCHGGSCAIFQQVGRCVMPKEGVFARVVKGGTVKAGDSISRRTRALRCHVITLSDRASQGVYEDRSGPKICEIMQTYAQQNAWRLQVETALIPDDAEQLRHAIKKARRAEAHIVLTTGGTGIGPRDIAPDVVSQLADKTIPGIMEHIRIRFGADKPNALLSRSVAATAGKTLIYTLPGSTQAVEEYLGEILKTFDHGLCMLNGFDTH